MNVEDTIAELDEKAVAIADRHCDKITIPDYSKMTRSNTEDTDHLAKLCRR